MASDTKKNELWGLRANVRVRFSVTVTPGSSQHKAGDCKARKEKLDSETALAVTVSGDLEKPKGTVGFRVRRCRSFRRNCSGSLSDGTCRKERSHDRFLDRTETLNGGNEGLRVNSANVAVATPPSPPASSQSSKSSTSVAASPYYFCITKHSEDFTSVKLLRFMIR